MPQDPADPAYREWRGAMAHKTGAANAWSVLAADPERGLVFVPTGSAAPDYYGALRLGDNRYANSIVALRAATGEVVWAFQTVHHDLWDYDNASPPALVTLTRDGRAVPAVLQATKTGMLFVLDRETGAPVFPVEERAVPASDIPLEEAARTQPFTAITPPLSPHRFTVDEVWGTTDADREACRAAIAGLRNEGIFTPPSVKGTLVLPSNIGGAHWGGVAVDPERQIAVVPVNRIAAMVQLIPRAGLRPEARAQGRRAARARLRVQHDARHALRHAATDAACRRRGCRARRRPSARWSRSISRPAAGSGKCRSARLPGWSARKWRQSSRPTGARPISAGPS